MLNKTGRRFNKGSFNCEMDEKILAILHNKHKGELKIYFLTGLTEGVKGREEFGRDFKAGVELSPGENCEKVFAALEKKWAYLSLIVSKFRGTFVSMWFIL